MYRIKIPVYKRVFKPRTNSKVCGFFLHLTLSPSAGERGAWWEKMNKCFTGSLPFGES
jgi:hypothetical protein